MQPLERRSPGGYAGCVVINSFYFFIIIIIFRYFSFLLSGRLRGGDGRGEGQPGPPRHRRSEGCARPARCAPLRRVCCCCAPGREAAEREAPPGLRRAGSLSACFSSSSPCEPASRPARRGSPGGSAEEVRRCGTPGAGGSGRWPRAPSGRDPARGTGVWSGAGGGGEGRRCCPGPAGVCQGLPVPRGGRALHNRAGGRGARAVPSGFTSRPCPEPYTRNGQLLLFLFCFVGVFPPHFPGPRRRTGAGGELRRGAGAVLAAVPPLPLRGWALTGSCRDFLKFPWGRCARGAAGTLLSSVPGPGTFPALRGWARLEVAVLLMLATGCARAGQAWRCSR